MTCPNCYTSLPKEALFCANCGRRVEVDTFTIPTVESSLRECDECGGELSADDIFCPQCGAVVVQKDPAVVSGIEQSGSGLPTVNIQTGPVRVRTAAERYVLQFSTGESFTVYGSGLVGRSPKPEPGEYFENLLGVLDVSRTVSKTHLEFGQEEGSFWVSDRFSANGTALHEPGKEGQRCEPGRRYRVARGIRVQIGEQFFVVN